LVDVESKYSTVWQLDIDREWSLSNDQDESASVGDSLGSECAIQVDLSVSEQDLLLLGRNVQLSSNDIDQAAQLSVRSNGHLDDGTIWMLHIH